MPRRFREKRDPLNAAAAGAVIGAIPGALVYDPQGSLRKNLQFILTMAAVGALTGVALSMER